MELIRCVRAFEAIGRMMSKEWDYKTAHSLLMTKNRLQPHVSFFAQEELKLVEEYAFKDEGGKIIWKENGAFSFCDPARTSEYYRRREELSKTKIEYEYKPLNAPTPASIRPVDLEALTDFINFGGEEDA